MPKTTLLNLDAWSIDEPQAQITLLISSTQAAARCPACNVPARHLHGRYSRTLADLPWSGYGITWRLRVRKLFCRNPTCPRRICTERLPGLAAPWARRTLRLTARLLAIGLALGGAAGVRLSRQFGFMVRDRAEAYAEASRAGAPAACQVADRFHLLQNLAAVLIEVFRSHAPGAFCWRRKGGTSTGPMSLGFTLGAA